MPSIFREYFDWHTHNPQQTHTLTQHTHRHAHIQRTPTHNNWNAKQWKKNM